MKKAHLMLLTLIPSLLLSSCATTRENGARPPQTDQRPGMAHPAGVERTAKAEYPEALRGLWIPEGMQCPRPIGLDGEYLLSISADMLGQYENTSKPLRVEGVPKQPAKWRILSTFSPGTGEYEGEEVVTFALNGDTLSIESGNAVSSYIKCN